MSKKPLTGDWVDVGNGIEYSKSANLWWSIKEQTVYDELSARHNGIIGMGAQLKQIIKQEASCGH